MDNFKYTLIEEEIKKETRTSKLRKRLSEYWNIADPYYRVDYLQSYTKYTDVDRVYNQIQHFNLAKLVIKRLEELTFNSAILPQYARKNTINVDMVMTLEEAYEYLKKAKDDN